NQGKPDTDHEASRAVIEQAADCPVGLEGVYQWVRFCPSREKPKSGVPNKYFGAFRNGEIKIRGLALRRRDTPPLLKKMQQEMIERLSKERDLEGCGLARQDLLDIVANYKD